MGALFQLLALLLIAGISGALGTALAGRRKRKGCLLSIATGFVGALVGTLLARYAQVPEPLPIQIGGTVFPVVWSILGAALLVAVLNLLRGKG